MKFYMINNVGSNVNINRVDQICLSLRSSSNNTNTRVM